MIARLLISARIAVALLFSAPIASAFLFSAPIASEFLFSAPIAAVIGPSAANAQVLESAVRHFDEGNIRFGQGDFLGALSNYERAIEEGFVSGALYFNMGNTYYRLDEIGQAIRYYEKAAEIMPRSPELIHNLEIVREQLVDQFSRLPEPFWKVWWRTVVRLFGITGLLVVGLIFYFAAAAALALRIRGGQTPWRRRVLTLSLILAGVFVAAGFSASIDAQTASRAVVILDEVALLEAPEGARSDLEIHEGLVVHVVESRDGWMEVRLPNGATGWVRRDTLGMI